jgi:hypothetical protein
MATKIGVSISTFPIAAAQEIAVQWTGSTMAAITAPSDQILTLGDLLNRLGGVSLDRVRMTPPPGHATEGDVIDVEARENRLCELVDGTLVEKATR